MNIRTKSILLATAGVLALSACTDPSIDTGDNRQRTKEGAAVGAVTGALLGIAIGDDPESRRRGAAIGAVVGGAAGAAIGDNLDRQAADLRNDIGDGRVQIINNGDYLVVRMPQDILFATDSSSVRGDLQDDLRGLANNLRRYPNSTVEVVGHTDNTGSAAYNQDLSARRASAVASVLINSGVSAGRVRSYGRGEDQPIASNLTVDGRAQNRRVEIVIRPN